MKAGLALPPAIPEAGAFAHSSCATRRIGCLLWRGIVACAKYLLGVVLCQSLLGSVLVVGWTFRLMQRTTLKSWWRRSAQCHNGRSFAAFLTNRAPTHAHRHWPNWFAQQNFLLAAQRPPGATLWKRVIQLIAAPLHSLWTNFKSGWQAMLNTWLLTLPGCILWLFAWSDGWNNSFNKGYEQAPVGPLTGVLGIAFFIAAMLYLPLAQARQASTGDWRSFYDFRLVWGLARRYWPACLLLAALYSLISLPVMALKTAPIFFTRDNPAIADFTRAEVAKLLDGYFFLAAMWVFPGYVVLRWAAARIYARGVLAGVQRGQIAVASLGETERQELSRLELLTVSPPRACHALDRVVRTASALAFHSLALPAIVFVWFTFVAQIFISEFLMYHPGVGWLNQPLVQLPWFHYLPPQVRHPWPEVIGAGFFTLAVCASVWAARRICMRRTGPQFEPVKA